MSPEALRKSSQTKPGREFLAASQVTSEALSLNSYFEISLFSGVADGLTGVWIFNKTDRRPGFANFRARAQEICHPFTGSTTCRSI